MSGSHWRSDVSCCPSMSAGFSIDCVSSTFSSILEFSFFLQRPQSAASSVSCFPSTLGRSPAHLTLSHLICSGMTLLENLRSEKMRPDPWNQSSLVARANLFHCQAVLLCADLASVQLTGGKTNAFPKDMVTRPSPPALYQRQEEEAERMQLWRHDNKGWGLLGTLGNTTNPRAAIRGCFSLQ